MANQKLNIYLQITFFHFLSPDPLKYWHMFFRLHFFCNCGSDSDREYACYVWQVVKTCCDIG